MFQTYFSQSSSIKSPDSPVKKSSSVASHDTEKSNPPPNAPDGGVWGTIMFNGEKSRKRNKVGCAFLLIPGLVMMGCPKDEKDAYAVWENVSQSQLVLVLVLLKSFY
jgi:hypothetical protein